MRLGVLFFGWVAAIIHVLFFCLESLLWQNAKVMAVFKQTAEQAATTSLLAFNQGFYNLFLALGLATGLILWMKERQSSGRILIVYTCIFMIGAALVLLFSSPQMIKGVVVQGVPPLLAVTLLVLQKDE